MSMLDRIKNVLVLLTVTVFVFVVLFGLDLSMSGNRKEMSGCPLIQNVASVCPMSASEHIAHWQQLFTTTVDQNILALLILVISFVGILIAILLRQSSGLSQYFQYTKRRFTNLFNYILDSLARGTLQPKLFA